MTLPVTLAETPALPRAAEAATAGPATGDGGAAFAETLAGAMGPAPRGAEAGQAAKGATGAIATDPGAAIGDASVAEATGAELATKAMLADLDHRVVAVEGEVLTATPALTTAAVAVPAETGSDGAETLGPELEIAGEIDPAPAEAGKTDMSEAGAGEDGEAVDASAAEEIPLALPLTALLAAALPQAPATEGAAPPVQASDAAVEAARRAMAATMTVPGLVKAEKAAKGPLDGPDAAETAAEGDVAKAEETEIGPAKTAVGAEARAAAVTVAPVATDLRQGAEARREAVAEITLATTVEGEAVQTAASSGSTTGVAAQAGAQALPPGAGGPILTGRPGWEAALADRIAAELSVDGKEIELDLAPETLGQLKIRLEVVDGLAQVRIVTETAEAARLFQQSEHRLSESLSRAGLSLGGQDTMSRDAQNSNAQGQAGQGGTGPGDRGGRPRGMEMHFDRKGTAALSEPAGRTGRGLVNLIA